MPVAPDMSWRGRFGRDKRIFVRKREIRRSRYVRRSAVRLFDDGIKNWRHSERSERQSVRYRTCLIWIKRLGRSRPKIHFVRVSKERIGHRGKRQNDHRTVAAAGGSPEYRF